jgi:hypothetical protein
MIHVREREWESFDELYARLWEGKGEESGERETNEDPEELEELEKRKMDLFVETAV